MCIFMDLDFMSFVFIFGASEQWSRKRDRGIKKDIKEEKNKYFLLIDWEFTKSIIDALMVFLTQPGFYLFDDLLKRRKETISRFSFSFRATLWILIDERNWDFFFDYQLSCQAIKVSIFRWNWMEQGQTFNWNVRNERLNCVTDDR